MSFKKKVIKIFLVVFIHFFKFSKAIIKEGSEEEILVFHKAIVNFDYGNDF